MDQTPEETDQAFAQRLRAELQPRLWQPGTRRAFNEQGLHVTPANFYSVIPTWDELETSFEFEEAQPFADPALFDDGRMLGVLEELTRHAAAFDPPREGDADQPGGFFWENPAFGFSDAMAYYAMVRRVRPAHVIEVGSGFSTLVASRALADNGAGEITCVEPFPRPWLKDVPRLRELVERPVQSLPPEWFGERLADGDILFIDSTHTVKSGSDCVHLYLRVLPRLDQALTLHAHDIFLPQGYPRAWAEKHLIFWNEQYLLHALLLGDPRVRVLYGSHYHLLNHPEALGRMMGGKAAPGGGSFWWEQSRR